MGMGWNGGLGKGWGGVGVGRVGLGWVGLGWGGVEYLRWDGGSLACIWVTARVNPLQNCSGLASRMSMPVPRITAAKPTANNVVIMESAAMRSAYGKVIRLGLCVLQSSEALTNNVLHSGAARRSPTMCYKVG